MNEAWDHVDSRLDELLDDRLGQEERLAVERHLATCERCRRRREALALVRRSVRVLAAEVEPTPSFVEAIARALDREDAEAPPVGLFRRMSVRPPNRRRWLAMAAAILLATALGGAFLVRFVVGADDVVRAAVNQHRQLGAAPLGPALAAPNAAAVQERWRRAELGFPARVLDLEEMGLVLEGGRVTELGGRRAALTVYRRLDDPSERLLCAMFAGDEAALPPADDVVREGGFVFHVYRSGERTAVFWAEGEVLCVLVGAGDPQEVLALAAAKAMAPQPRV